MMAKKRRRRRRGEGGVGDGGCEVEKWKREFECYVE